MVGPRQILLGGVALLALTGVAAAADVPMRAPAAPVFTKAAPAWSWEGQYIGVHGGYFDGTNNVVGVDINPRGGFGGVQFGYLHHLSRNWVLGYEIDLSFGDINGTTGATTNDIKVFGTARTRLGYAQGPWLFYGTAGVAWAKTDFIAAPVTAERAQIGYAVGAGIEYAFAPNWSAKVEYIYMDLGETTANVSVFGTDLTASTVRFGLNYRFANWNPSQVSAFPVKAPVRFAGWTGPYIGVHGGWSTAEYDSVGFGPVSLDPSGGLFGIQSGYNWQLSRNWVFGLEADSSWGRIRETVGVNTVDVDAMGTVRGRFGYANGNFLTYVTGGLAWIHADVALGPVAVTRDQFYLGWTVGAGLEYALSERWSAKLEYLYSEYDSSDLAIIPFSDDFKIHTIKLGINYRAGIFDLLGMR
jgi:outer membrane immunogenic protein